MAVELSEEQSAQRDAFVERVLAAAGGAFDIFAMFIGFRLGYYDALAGQWLIAPDLAQRTGTQERYAREWLEQQTVTGVLEVENPDAAPAERRFRLPAAHAEVLTDIDSPNYVLPLAPLIAGAVRPIDKLLNAYRRGGGVPYSDYGADLREGQAAINRVTFLQDLPQTWLPALPDLYERLTAGAPVRVADIGMGAGWSSIGIAQAFPNAHVEGFDLDGPSVELARQNAAAAGLADRVHFHARDAGDPELAGRYDLVMALECIHDLADPVSVLGTMRRLAGERGTVLIVDERVGEKFTPQGSDVEPMMYGWSILHCLPVGMDAEQTAATGTVMRPDTLRSYAVAAGFSEVEILPIDSFFFNIYRLHQ